MPDFLPVLHFENCLAPWMVLTKAQTASAFFCPPTMTEDFTTKIDPAGFRELCQALTTSGHKGGEQQQEMSVLHATLGDPTLGSASITPVTSNEYIFFGLTSMIKICLEDKFLWYSTYCSSHHNSLSLQKTT